MFGILSRYILQSWYSGCASAFQADETSSILVLCSIRKGKMRKIAILLCWNMFVIGLAGPFLISASSNTAVVAGIILVISSALLLGNEIYKYGKERYNTNEE